MIAFGICAMGGCFAQNSGGLTLESYWPAAMVDITSSEIAILERHPFPGGDSQNDVYMARVYVDLLNPPADIVSGTLPYGFANAQTSTNTWLMSGVYFTTYTASVSLQYGNQTTNIPLFSGWCEVLAERNSCTWTLDSTPLASMTDSFSLAEDWTRNRFVRTGQIRQFSYMAYWNARTGISWVVFAMRTPGGLSALWSTDSLTLTEI